MYIEIVRDVINNVVEKLAKNRQLPKHKIHEGIKEHIVSTSRQYRTADPQIDYEDSLCRLGYLYTNVAVNATIFEKVILGSTELKQSIGETRKGTLHVCALGGGPGTELLGIAKYLMHRPGSELPNKLAFTIVDSVPHWAETWRQLASAVEREFEGVVEGRPPTFDKTFFHLDVLDRSSYESHDFQFQDADVVVFNYLFSENKVRLDEVGEALRYLAQITSDNCAIVVIDRLEGDRQFNDKLVRLFESAFNVTVALNTLNGKLDSDEQTSDMSELVAAFGRQPRIKFYSDYGSPTVSWFVVKRK